MFNLLDFLVYFYLSSDLYMKIWRRKIFSTYLISCSFMLNRVNFKTYKSLNFDFLFFMIGFSATRIFLTQLMYKIICMKVNTSDLQHFTSTLILCCLVAMARRITLLWLSWYFPLDYLLFNFCVMISCSCKVPSDKNRISSSSISAW